MVLDLKIAPSGQTIVKPTALGPIANTDTKLLIYGLFQKGRVLAQDGIETRSTEHGGILRTLALMNGCSVCRNQRVKLAEAIGDGAPVEMRGQLADFGIDIVDIAVAWCITGRRTGGGSAGMR